MGGSCESVGVMVHDAAQRSEANVFGVVDRDFRETNAPHWLDMTREIRCFVLPAHEIENYSLDAEALANCDANNRGRSQAGVEARMKARAQQLAWWMACRRTIKRISRLCVDGFINMPNPGLIVDMASARRISRATPGSHASRMMLRRSSQQGRSPIGLTRRRSSTPRTLPPMPGKSLSRGRRYSAMCEAISTSQPNVQLPRLTMSMLQNRLLGGKSRIIESLLISPTSWRPFRLGRYDEHASIKTLDRTGQAPSRRCPAFRLVRERHRDTPPVIDAMKCRNL